MKSEHVIDTVARVTSVKASVICGDRRSKSAVYARTLSIGLLRETFPEWSNQDLALSCGLTNSSSVTACFQRIEKWKANDSFRTHWRAAVRILCGPPATV
jgi:chromosomal replication initiation ATPase DnaA